MEPYIVKIKDDVLNKEIILPMTPSEITKSGAAIERGITSAFSGEMARPKGRKAYRYAFSGILLDDNFDFPQFSSITAKEFEYILGEWQGYRAPYNRKLHMVISDTATNRFVYLANHTIDYRGAGRTLHYTVEFVEWRDYEIQVFDAVKTSTDKKRPALPKEKKYTIKKGDSLFKIARKYTTNGAKWKELYELNKSKLKSGDPNLIYPGEKLTIPPGWLK